MSDKATATCRDCVFWAPLQNNEKLGRCRRAAPVGALFSSEEKHPKAFYQFPRVYGSEWCGEWEARK